MVHSLIGYFVQALAGLEKSEFKSKLGFTADVTFVNLAIHAGYQWYWQNGFNLSLMAGVVYLNVNRNIMTNESVAVADFLGENTESNFHGGASVIVGWLF